MTEAEKTKKFLNYAGLEHVVELLVSHGFKGGMGLSQENFTTELKAKYDALVAASSVEDLTALFNRVTALEALIEADSDQAINKFNEIVEFLAGIQPGSDTLAAKLADIATQIADAKKAGTDATSALNTYKTSNDAAVAAAKKAGTDAASSLETYKTSNDAAVKALQDGKLNASDLVAITNAEIDTLVKA